MYIQQQFISTLMGFLLMKKIAYSLIGLTALLGANTVFAAGDVAAGKVKAAVCAACHGANGIAMMPGYPNLAGQNEAYLVSAMKAYRDKQRTGGMSVVMQMQAASLSDADIDNLAAHFASLK